MEKEFNNPEALDELYEKAKDQLLRLGVADSDAEHQNEVFKSVKGMRDIALRMADQLANYQINLPIEDIKNKKLIPWTILEQISKKYSVDRVILFATNENTEIQNIVTFGTSVYESHLAAEEGNYLKKFLDWPESQRNAVSGKVQELLEAMKLAQHELIGAERQRSTAYKEIQRLLIKFNQED